MLEPALIQCPYCWEELEVFVDPSVRDQEYVEDCQVCCQPIVIHAWFDEEGDVHLTATPEND